MSVLVNIITLVCLVFCCVDLSQCVLLFKSIVLIFTAAKMDTAAVMSNFLKFQDMFRVLDALQILSHLWPPLACVKGNLLLRQIIIGDLKIFIRRHKHMYDFDRSVHLFLVLLHF